MSATLTDDGTTGTATSDTGPALLPLGRAVPTAVGSMTVEPLDVERHLDLLHAWVTHPKSAFWQMLDADRAETRRVYEEIARDPHHHAWLGLRDGEPAFLVETYDPAHSVLAQHYRPQAGDVGMHLLVAPTDRPERGFTSAVMGAVMTLLFASPRCGRVVVEPDVRNAAIAAKNAEVGFVVVREIALPDKVAHLAFCTRERFEAAVDGGPAAARADILDHHQGVAGPAAMTAAQRHLVTKMLSEFAHERLLAPSTELPGAYSVTTPAGTVYRFRARTLPLEHWAIDAASVTKQADGRPAALDAQLLIVELRDLLGIPDHLIGTYLEEVAATLAANAAKIAKGTGSTVEELLDAPLPRIETAMTEGHPGFVANSGRIGFGASDLATYAPEHGNPVRLFWLAARREHTRLTLGEGLDEETLYREQLGADTLARFASRLEGLGLDPEDYHYLPVHPWQWEHKVAITFAPDVAARRLVPLGEGPDRYLAQQSIRTFLNVDEPRRWYVKVALAVQNMGFLRGLSPAYMRATPAINDWVAGLVGAPGVAGSDGEFARCGFSVLRERASIGYTGDAYHAAYELGGRPPGPSSAQRRMIAGLWRESAVATLEDGERAATMAALLHRDVHGRSLAAAWIGASGLSVEEWLDAYLRCYLRPLVHALLAHDVAFMPHGENLILVYRDHRPVRALLKDIGEEVAVMDDQPLPAEVERIRMSASDEVKALAVFTDVFDGFLRHLAAILDTDGVLAADAFWQRVAACVAGHRADHPGLHERLDLFTPRFQHSCLNRLQLRNTLQMVDLTDQASSLVMAGTLANPIAGRDRA